jgi:lipopolysaccharide biosynthesis glycosyltransferase
VNYPGGFFNSGVLLMDLDVMRREGCTEELLRYANDNRDALLWPDQDVLNAVFAGRWMSLHPRWNVQNSFWSWADWALDVFSAADLREAMTSPRIRHFEGPSLSKPWHYLCPLPGRMEYRAVLAETPWANRPLEDRTVATRLIRMLPRAWWTPTYKTLLRSRLRFSNRSSGAR